MTYKFITDKYLTALNANCPSLEGFRVKWSVTDLDPKNIRTYCKTDGVSMNGMCWSCSDYIKKYKDELYEYEKGPGATMDLLREIQANQADLNAKLDRILSLLEGKTSLS